VSKYKTLQNFGESKNRIKGNFGRMALYVLIYYLIQIAVQFLMGYINNATIAGVGVMRS